MFVCIFFLYLYFWEEKIGSWCQGFQESCLHFSVYFIGSPVFNGFAQGGQFLVSVGQNRRGVEIRKLG
jgi:hypothetical protein